MFLKDAQLAIKALLANNAYFTQPPAISLLIEGQPNVRKTLSTELNKTGIVIVVSKAKIKRQAGRAASVNFSVVVYENTERNQDADIGTAGSVIGLRDAEDVCAKAWGVLDAQNIHEGLSAIRVLGFEQTDSGEGLDLYELELSTETTIGMIETLLAASSGENLTNESGETIDLEPITPP